MASLQLFVVAVVVLSSYARAQPADKVVVGFYAESLCPDCINFSIKYMNVAFQEIPSIFTLNYVPWGNAVIKGGSFDCQHGTMECTINTIDACVIHYYPNQTDFWPFVECMVEKGAFQDPTDAQNCAEKLSLKWDLIQPCYTGLMGHNLELMYANETASLKPPHQYTPWITINGEHSTDAENGDLIKVVCNTYQGSDKPAACNQ
eukprot:Em0005g913a